MGILRYVLLAFGIVWSHTCYAQERRSVDMILVLAIDVSYSVDIKGWEKQRDGYAHAFQSPEVARAIASGPTQSIAVTIVQWSNYDLQKQVGGWSVLDSHNLREFSQMASTMEKQHGDMTSTQGAILYCTDLVERAPFDAPRRVIDISGDGTDNSFAPRGQVYGSVTPSAAAVAKGIVINGLPMAGDERDIEAFYHDNVIGGAGSFTIFVPSLSDPAIFERALIAKLVREIAMND